MSWGSFGLFQSQHDFVREYWKKVVCLGDLVVDATAGNGYDSETLAKYVLTPTQGELHVFDIQKVALKNTEELICKNHPELISRVHFHEMCHSNVGKVLPQNSVSLIVYNLGYLPKGEKSKTTLTETTLESVSQGLNLLKPKGLISIVTYPGHKEGSGEEKALLDYLKTLKPDLFSVTFHTWVNRNLSPNLILIQKS